MPMPLMSVSSSQALSTQSSTQPPPSPSQIPLQPNSKNVKSNVREILAPDLQKELLLLEEQEGSINFKFGIVYAKHGQLIDDEMFANGNIN
jgi:hypothetical protein